MIRLLKNVIRKVIKIVKRRQFLAEGLTRVPSVKESVISDLFIWRKDKDWKTYFELLDINSLINANYQGTENDFATFVFYHQSGREISRKKVLVKPGRQTIEVSALLPNDTEGWGTYSCFHQNISKTIIESESFIAERGYSGYEWTNMSARGYVHGNLDAVAHSIKGVEMLGTSWKKSLIYRLQHELTGPATYEFALVNPTKKSQRIEFIFRDPLSEIALDEVIHLASRASFIKRIEIKKDEKLQLSIRSKLYMARPVVFRLQAYSMDVFHG